MNDSVKKPEKPPLFGFDREYYLLLNPDVAVSGADPEKHFLDPGWKEGRDPCRHFSVRGYLAANPDVAESGMNPLLHFLEFGIVQGRKGWER